MRAALQRACIHSSLGGLNDWESSTGQYACSVRWVGCSGSAHNAVSIHVVELIVYVGNTMLTELLNKNLAL